MPFNDNLYKIYQKGEILCINKEENKIRLNYLNYNIIIIIIIKV